jgi:hypothetical protein
MTDRQHLRERKSTKDQIYEYACDEENEAMSGTLSDARVQEKHTELAAKKTGSNWVREVRENPRESTSRSSRLLHPCVHGDLHRAAIHV